MTLLYVLPALPSGLVDDREVSRESGLQLKAIEDKNVQMAKRILAEAKKAIVQKGFDERRVKTVYRKRLVSLGISAATESQVTLFHAMRDLRRFMPKEVLDEAPELEKLWKQKAGEQIGPYMKKEFSMGNVATKVLEGAGSMTVCIVQ